jgi:outer membrane protein assembly factor BamB
VNGRRLLSLAILTVATVVPGFLAGIYLHEEGTIDYQKGSSTVEFVTTQRAPEKPRPRRVVLRLPWPTYGLRVQRTHTSSDFKLRPPFRLRWTFKAGHVLEFPPSIAYGRLYFAQQRGRFYAVHHRTGKLVWQRRFNHCSASSPTIAYRVVYHAWMQPLPCNRYPRNQPGMITAMAARTGKIVWRFRGGGPFETSPLVIGKTLYAGSWDHKLYAINIYTGKARWTFTADHEINSSPAYANGLIYFGTDAGSVYALDARTGRQRWRAQAGTSFGRREYFYATPTIAYGRVYIGNTDGTLYAFGASSGRLLWAQRAGTYIYTAAAVWRQRVYVGTYDGYFMAFNAATGDRLWRFSASAAIHGAPSVIDGLVYFAACPRCGSVASRYAKQGDRGTYALNALTGRQVWHWPDGVFSPAIADSQHLYIAGRSRVFSFAPKRRQARKQRAKKQRAKRSKARSSTSSGRRGQGRAARRSRRQSPPRRSTSG